MTGGGAAARSWIAVFGLGGTIASAPDAQGRAVPSRDIAVTLEELGCIPPGLEVRGTQFRQVASSELTVQDIVALSGEIEHAITEGASGVVVAQGTDSIEETAFGLDLLVAARRVPIVVTGAMRHPDVPGSDAGANLAAALDVAASPLAAGQGVVVVMNDEIHSARFVRKAHTSSPAAFQSSPVGPIGWVVERRAHLPLALRASVPPIALPDAQTLPRVATVSIGPGDDGALLDAVDASGYAGCVVEAMGGGHVSSAVTPALGRLAARLPVVLSSRAGAGSMLERTYAFPGSESDLLDRGLIPAGHLPSSKARVLLTLMLAAGIDRAAITATFPSYSQYDLPGHTGE